MSVIVSWIKNARSVALPQSALPALVAIFFGAKSDSFSLTLSVVALLGVMSAHLGANLWDDYFDLKKNDSSYRDRLASNGIRARIAKCDYIQDGRATVKQLFIAATLFSLFALLMGAIVLVFRWDQRVSLLIIVLITALLSLSYSGPPLRLSYIGLGEITLGIIFGPLLMQGVSIAASGTTTVPGLIISCIVGILVINILYTHAVMDFEADRAIHKNTLAVVLNNQKWITFFSALFIFFPFVLIVCFVLLNMLPPIFLITLWILPIAISLFRSILAFQKDPSSSISRRWYHFPMERWKEITQAGIDWFMLRWYSARNLVLFFCLTYVGIALFYPI